MDCKNNNFPDELCPFKLSTVQALKIALIWQQQSQNVRLSHESQSLFSSYSRETNFDCESSEIPWWFHDVCQNLSQTLSILIWYSVKTTYLHAVQTKLFYDLKNTSKHTDYSKNRYFTGTPWITQNWRK